MRWQRQGKSMGKDAHKLPAKQLKHIFIAVMIYMGLKMIGVFAWFHLPI
jgi:uncharacterized membrane protein YfcA